MTPISHTLPSGAILTEFPTAIPSNVPRPAVIVIPGGGYHWCYPNEMEPPAAAFAAAGLRAFVLTYTTAPLPLGWKPLVDGGEAIQYLRQNRAALGVDPQKIALCGFSAGGHLAAALSILADHPHITAALSPAADHRPNAVVLCYPVITGGEFGHQGSKTNLCGDDPALQAVFSLEEQVRPGLPPFFLWHAVPDQDVPVENSLLLAAALRRNQVPFELHLFGSGGHGTSLCTPACGTDDPHNAHWFPLCLEWLGQIFCDRFSIHSLYK